MRVLNPFLFVLFLVYLSQDLLADDAVSEATAFREAGHYREALVVLERAREHGEGNSSPWLREQSLALRGLGRREEALAANADALERAAGLGPAWEARVLNDRGLLLAESGAAVDALAAFDAAGRLAVGDAGLALTVALNRGRLALDTGRHGELDAAVDNAARLLEADIPPTRAGWGHLALGRLYQRGNREGGRPAAWRALALEQFRSAGDLGRKLNDPRLVAWSQGFEAGLYADEHQYEAALARSRQAAFTAQSVGADDQLYRWQWQSARSLAALGETEASALAYHQAIATLGRLQPHLAEGAGQSFRELAAPVFFEFADLRLRQTATLPTGNEKRGYLKEVREVIERAKLAEVQEYFQDQCVQGEGQGTVLDQLAGNAAIIYPILLPDRIELLVTLPDDIRQFTVPVSADRLTGEVRAFRERIERYDQRQDFLVHARTLYDWLIAPLESWLRWSDVDTLVIVPDGPLRTIPLAALHDGQRYLVERFAVATTPGLTLTAPRPLEREQVDLLAGGITQSVQGFSALPNVAVELDSISEAFPADTLRDEAFLVDEVQRRIAEGDQDIVHIATHGQFDSDHRQSFLLAYDDKLTMDRLQTTISRRGRQDEPLELLVLSACQTAAGDDRAALGLAGVALKAGARSALATLWFVNDASTARMIERFYQALGEPTNTKAEALRQAQLDLIQDPRFAHPSYWAPFLLIGNWL